MTKAIEWQDLVPLEYYKITVDSTNHILQSYYILQYMHFAEVDLDE